MSKLLFVILFVAACARATGNGNGDVPGEHLGTPAPDTSGGSTGTGTVSGTEVLDVTPADLTTAPVADLGTATVPDLTSATADLAGDTVDLAGDDAAQGVVDSGTHNVTDSGTGVDSGTDNNTCPCPTGHGRKLGWCKDHHDPKGFAYGHEKRCK